MRSSVCWCELSLHTGCSQQTTPFSPPCSHRLLHFRKEPLPSSISAFLPIYLSTSSHHPPLSASPRCSHYFPSISSRFVYHLLPSKFVFIPLFILFFFLPDLLLSSPPALYSLAYFFFFSNPRRVSQLKALSSSYGPVVSLCTIRSALALGFCNSLTSSLPFLSSLCGFFSPPRFVSFIFSPDLSTEVFAL